MRTTRALVAGAALTAALAAVPGAPLAAQEPTHTITVTPASARPGEAFAVTGSVPGCANAPYFVDLVYSYYGESRFWQVEGTTDAEGGYSTSITVPEQAWAGDGSIQGHARCEGTPVYSSKVDVEIVPHAGSLTVTPTSGRAGTRVALHGTNCWGPDIRLAFRGEDVDHGIVDGIQRTPGPDPDDFTVSYVIPADARPGESAFVAACPGTVSPRARFTGGGAAAPPPAAPPATPVPGEPDFTG